MSTRLENSFLPTGAISTPGPYYSLPYYLSPPRTTDTTFQNHNHHPRFTFEQASVMSPPKTRSGSTNDSNLSLTEDWGLFVQQLRNQFQGERAHMRADRDRMQEVIEGERELWDRERQIWNKERNALRTRITDLETKLLSIPDPPLNSSHAPFLSNLKTSLPSPKNIDNSSSTVIQQESGRNADGSPFYAPAPENPNRTFDTETASNLRVDDLAIPQETAIRVTSKELTSSDFIQKMCPLITEDGPLNTIGESIDISHIQPELDSVSIRVSAISPAFAAKALPQRLLTKSNCQSKNMPDSTDMKNIQYDSINEEENPSSALCSQPENKRLILFAGHTPNFRETDFDMETEPTLAQVKLSEFQNTVPSLFEKQEFDRYGLEVKDDDDDDDNDDELSEPLGLINAIPQDDSFLAQLTEKLTQVVDSSSKCKPTQIDVVESSPLSSSHEDEEAEGSIMKMKSSLNFGRPFGSM